jgi:aldose sugar dehydrogenase
MRVSSLLLTLLALGCSGGCAAANTGAGMSSPECLLVSDGLGPIGTTKVKAQLVVSGLEVPWGIAFLPNGDLLVTERPGRIRLVKGGVLQPTAVATVPLAAGGESGLLGIALHPGFAQNRFFFVYATVDAGGRQNRIERWKLSDDSTSATFDGVVRGGIAAAQFHDGGRLRIGPDGMLYAGTGDARSPDLSQDANSPNGKILRLTPEGEVPQDNPISGNPAFVLGLRNVQGFDWLDAATLVIADHGPSGELGRSGHDEIDVAKAGENLGWPTIFGCGASGSLVRPKLTFKDAVPPGGAAIYRGSAIPAWKDSVLVGVLGSTHLHRVVFDAERRVSSHEVYFKNELGRIREVISGPDGELYLTTSNCDGRGDCPSDKDRILKIVPQ